MQTTPLLIICLSLAALALGCDQGPADSRKMEQVGAAGQAATPEQRDYTYAQKAEFTAEMQRQLAEINGELEQLSAKIEQSSDAVKVRAQPKLQALRDQAASLNKHLAAAAHTTESTWETFKSGTRTAYAATKEGFQEFRQWLSEKIAP